MHLRYRPGPEPFSPDNLAITLTLRDRPVTWTPGTPDRGNLGGTRRTLDGAAGPEQLGPGLLSRDGWVLVDDSHAVRFVEQGAWVAPRPSHDLQDWYFFGYGHAYTDALGDYTRFGGPIPLIPRFVLGAWWSRYWAYSAADLQQLVEEFAAHDLPLDVLVLDMDWHTPDSWTGYTWNRDLFPDPAGFLRWAHERGLRTTLNLHPAEGVQPFERVYPDFARALGVDPESRAAVTFRPGDPEYVRHYFELLHHPLEDQGVDFWWMDWQQGETSDLPGLDPLIWLNHLHYHDSTRRGMRPMLYSRWGGLGNHRYPIGFSGDTFAVWRVLAYLSPFTATAANVLYGWWSHDIGGHFGATEPELFARWVQFGALSPCLRLHATKDPAAERRPWAFPPRVFEAVRTAFHWRYRLVPYLYTMARAAMDTGLALCRPLYFAAPDEDSAYVADAAYFLGDDVIAVPITRPADPATGMAWIDAWLPQGTWIDFQTGETYTGPRWVRLVGDLERVPLLVRAGAIIPLAEVAPTTDRIPADVLTLAVFPGRSGSFRLYEDDGATLAYQEGASEWTPFSMQTDDSGTCRVRIGPVEGRCPALPPVRRYVVRFEGTRPPESVTIDGAPAEWHYDEAARATVVRVPPTPKERAVEVAAQAAGGLSALGEGHNRAVAGADARRLLGGALPDASWDALPSAVLGRDHPQRATALARLGAPFAHAVEYVTWPEAANQLGRLIVGAAAGGGPFDLQVTWTLHDSGGTTTRTEELAGLRSAQVLAAPFAFDGPARPLCWDVTARLTWRGGTWDMHYAAMPLFPTVPAWRLAVFDPTQHPVSPDEAARGEGGLDWQPRVQDPATARSLTAPHGLWLVRDHRAALEAGRPLAAYAVTRITADAPHDVRIVFQGGGPITFLLDGRTVPEAPGETAPPLGALPTFRTPRVSAPLRIDPGTHTLVARIESAREGDRFQFNLVAALLGPDGAVPTGLRYTI